MFARYVHWKRTTSIPPTVLGLNKLLTFRSVVTCRANKRRKASFLTICLRFVGDDCLCRRLCNLIKIARLPPSHTFVFSIADGDHSLTAPLSDAHVDESFGLANDAEDTDADANESAEETPVNGPSEGAGKIDSNDGERGSSSNGPPGTGEMVLQENSGTSHVEGSHETETCTAESDAARKAARPQRRLVGNEDVGGDPEVSASEGGTIVREDASVRREEAGVSEGQTLVPSEDGGALMDGGVVDDGSRELSPENIRVELSLAGRKALAGDDTDSDVPTDVGHPATGGGSTSPRRSNVARSLFVDTGRGEGVDGHGRGTKQHGRGENVAEEVGDGMGGGCVWIFCRGNWCSALDLGCQV